MKPDQMLEDAKLAAQAIADDPTVDAPVSRHLLDQLEIYVRQLRAEL